MVKFQSTDDGLYIETATEDTFPQLEEMKSKEQKIYVQKAIDSLSEIDGVIITLFYIDESSIQEIIEITGLSESNVKVKLHRARKQLKINLEELLQTGIEINHLMEKKNNDILKKGLMETKMDFTSNLMDKINAEEKALSTVLSKSGSLETSKDFTIDLMSKLEGRVPVKPYESVISKRAWIGIAAVFIGVVVLTLLANDQVESSIKYDLGLDKITNSLVQFFKFSPVLTYICFGSLLFTLGLIYEQRSRKTT